MKGFIFKPRSVKKKTLERPAAKDNNKPPQFGCDFSESIYAGERSFRPPPSGRHSVSLAPPTTSSLTKTPRPHARRD